MSHFNDVGIGDAIPNRLKCAHLENITDVMAKHD